MMLERTAINKPCHVVSFGIGGGLPSGIITMRVELALHSMEAATRVHVVIGLLTDTLVPTWATMELARGSHQP